MVQVSQNAVIYRGNRKVLRFTITDEDADAPLDITSYEILFAVTRTNSSGQPIQTGAVIDLNSTDHSAQVVKTTPASGIVDVILLEADTVDLKPGEYYLELEGVDSSDNSEVFATGSLTIEPNVENA